MNWLPIRSRIGNKVLLVLGVLFAVSSTALLVFYVIDSWGYSTMRDKVLQLFLVGIAAYGVALAIGARDNIRSA